MSDPTTGYSAMVAKCYRCKRPIGAHTGCHIVGEGFACSLCRHYDIQDRRLEGFHKLKEGCIHLRCQLCNRKQSNMFRDENDPPDAVLAEVPCPKCCDKFACDKPITDFYDINGVQLDPFAWMDDPKYSGD